MLTETNKRTGYPSIDRPWEKYYSDHVMQFEFPRTTMYRCIFDNNKNYQNRIAMEYFGKPFSYKELFEQIDDTAILVAVPFQSFAHNDIGLVRVDADVRDLALAIIQKRIQNAMRAGRAGDTMDDVIRLLIEPLAVVDFVVSHLGARQKGECPHYPALLIKHHMAAA